MSSKELSVTAINKGTVIDHIPAEYTTKVAGLLDLESLGSTVIVAWNLPSKKNGKKGIIKVEDIYLDSRCLKKIALIAPDVTVSKIDDYRVIEKTKLERPKLLQGIVKCFNPHCITNNEAMDTRFVLESEHPLIIRCKYCERQTKKEDIELL